MRKFLPILILAVLIAVSFQRPDHSPPIATIGRESNLIPPDRVGASDPGPSTALDSESSVASEEGTGSQTNEDSGSADEVAFARYLGHGALHQADSRKILAMLRKQSA